MYHFKKGLSMVSVQQHHICFVIGLTRIPDVLRGGLFRAFAMLLDAYLLG